jgi:hypothetical protein
MFNIKWRVLEKVKQHAPEQFFQYYGMEESGTSNQWQRLKTDNY